MMRTSRRRQLQQIGDVKVGVVHGHDVQPWGDAKALEARRRRLDVDVLSRATRIEPKCGRRAIICI